MWRESEESLTRIVPTTYDPLHRLTGAEYSTGESFAYAYDAVGNRTAYTATTPLSGTLVTTYTYDTARRLTARTVSDGRAYTYTWSARGQLLAEYTQGYPVRTFTYDGAGRLVEATVFTRTTRFTYNGLGDRVAVEVVGQGVITYTLDLAAGGRILAEEALTNTTLYLYGPECVGELRDGQWLYYLADAEGLVRQGVDAQGEVVSSWLFDPDGAVLEGPEGPVSHLVCGGVYDWSTGLIYRDKRYFDPTLGIWLALTPLMVQTWRGRCRQRWVLWVSLLLLVVCMGGTLTACGGSTSTPMSTVCTEIPSPLPTAIMPAPTAWPTPVQTSVSETSMPTIPPTDTPTPITPLPESMTPGSDAYELAEMMFWEERQWWDENEDAFRVVGWVVINRVDDPRFPNSVPGVLEQVTGGNPAFEAYYYNRHVDVADVVAGRWPGDPDLEAWKLAQRVASEVIQRKGTDPTAGALFFYNGDAILPFIQAWAQADPVGFRWGHVANTDLYYFNRNPFDPTPTPAP